ncbi:uncharacterized protein A4U43_C07F4510 [Asparagus officinalis]|uniref:Uncharacterized protein n=1 Tax=Asparagus officinalis TaxID=4686 RepID=A0A5P1E9J4_ASPOF|nr:uncharacterized protein A4U43_C07F4510 [Asparagus officinalis]
MDEGCRGWGWRARGRWSGGEWPNGGVRGVPCGVVRLSGQERERGACFGFGGRTCVCVHGHEKRGRRTLEFERGRGWTEMEREVVGGWVGWSEGFGAGRKKKKKEMSFLLLSELLKMGGVR